MTLAADRDAATSSVGMGLGDAMEQRTAVEWSRAADGARAVGGEAAQPDRLLAIRKAVKVWSGQLVDLSGRNNLLYFKDLKRGTLDLAEARPERVNDLLAGKVVALSRLFSDEEERALANKRARTIRNKAEEHFEERGLQTLYIACGMATWASSTSSATPAAPVLLCPVRLAPRGAAQEDFELSLTGELEVNPTLLQLLGTEFDCQCDPAELLDRVEIEGAIDTPEELAAVYDWLEERAASVPGFSVAPRFVLGTFSYAKLPMVNDLEQAVDAMVAHDLIAAIAGDADARARLRESQGSVEVPDPNHTPLADEFLILDADESQNYAINAVLHGQNLIVKGPPGTGKSQTIANLISTLLARGQKVLFVAEKRAAIDAVLKRLEQRELDDLVLDLHSASGTRRKTAQALARALHTNRTIPRPNHQAQQQRVEARRAELNGRVEALREPRAPWGVSVHEVQVRLMGVPDSARSGVRLAGAALTGLGGDEYTQAQENLREFAFRGGLELPASGSPWARAPIMSEDQASAALSLVRRLAQHSLPTATRQLEEAAAATGLQPPATLGGWAERLELWSAAAHNSAAFTDEIYDEQLADRLEATLPMEAGAFARAGKTIGSGEFRRARKQLRARVREGAALSQPELHQRAAEALDCFSRWSAVRTDAGVPHQPRALEALTATWQQLTLELSELQQHLACGDLLGLDPTGLEALLTGLLGDQTTLFKLPELRRLGDALAVAGLTQLLEDLGRRQVAPDLALTCLEFVWLSSILEAVSISDRRVGAFDGELHRRTVEEFRHGDAEHIESTATRVRRICAERATAAQNDFPDETALIEHQAGLKRRHLALRQLFGAAPNVLTSLKPCWAMSPLMVSQVLPADKQYFDVVVFDEASQVTPADAVPAMIRGKHVVVAGDDKQLPPTAFFAASGGGEDAAAQEEELSISITSGFESILDALGAFVPFRMLRWHYRSRDERLITFSNLHFYDRSLVTFPGVTGQQCLEHVLVPFEPGLVGQEQSVSAEVDKAVELILAHARAHPNESLGVIAMGIKHAQRIDEELRQRLADSPDLESFFDEGKQEKFFVKNLERVQGDERDAIILSIGYGKDANGRLLYRFGPLNQQGGERRLNVAVTRAKQRMTLVSSFGSADMDPNRSSAEGVKLLRAYLQYAESRGSNLGDAIDSKPELNPFEIDVRDALLAAGVPVVPQYGCSGYRIDFAAAHPKQPGRMVLAIECDGATYHSSESARDRDRLRQDQLERLGWTFHRIWSQDWFHNKERELARVVEAHRAAVLAADEDARRPSAAPSPQVQAPTESSQSATAPRRGPRPYLPMWSSIDDYSQQELRNLVRWIQSDTLLRTDDQLLREAITELGFARRGKKITAALGQAIAAERRIHG